MTGVQTCALPIYFRHRRFSHERFRWFFLFQSCLTNNGKGDTVNDFQSFFSDSVSGKYPGTDSDLSGFQSCKADHETDR